VTARKLVIKNQTTWLWKRTLVHPPRRIRSRVSHPDDPAGGEKKLRLSETSISKWEEVGVGEVIPQEEQ
jgi:ribosomal protein L31E